jgi:2-methylisocitrate lyase-like PEP mutase family enzyme
MIDDLNASPEPSSLKSRIAQGRVVIAPGVYDALTASLAASAGFEALYLSGAAIAYTRLDRPDIGLVSSSEVADALAHVCERVETPVIVDADTGYGNALNVQRTVRLFERAGAAAIQLEDQTFPKRCGHLDGKSVVPMNEMIGKIRAAVDARRRARTMIIARTDAAAIEGFESAIERAESYANAGADVLFVEAPRTREQLRAVATALSNRVPLLANMVEGGKTPILSGTELEALGFRLVIFPGAIVRALVQTAVDFYGVLKRDGTTDAFRDRMFDFETLNGVLGTADILARGRRYEGGDRAGRQGR